MRDVERQELEDHLSEICGAVEDGYIILQGKGTAQDFLTQVCNRLEQIVKALRKDVVRHTRIHQRGLKQNGEPDKRFNRHRTAQDREKDGRFNKAGGL